MASDETTPPIGLDRPAKDKVAKDKMAEGMPAKGKSLVEPTVTDDPAEAGPTSPGHVVPTDDQGPATGGYDDHSPSRHPTNKEGGYGAG